MFKRVQKRVAKREREEELGITAEVKEVMGLNDTDSDESQSDSDADDSNDEDISENDPDSDAGLVANSRKRKRAFEDEDGDEEANESSEDGDGDDDQSITVSQALENPLHPTSRFKACVICPGKLLKNEPMEQTHLSSTVSLLHCCKGPEVQLTRCSAEP